MTCCTSIIQTFSLTDKTVIAYNGEFGATPKVDILYNENGQWIQSGVFTTTLIKPTSIEIYHGNPTATGIAKVW